MGGGQGGEQKEITKGYKQTIAVMPMFIIWNVLIVSQCIHMSQLIKLYTKTCSLLCINFTSVKLLKNEIAKQLRDYGYSFIILLDKIQFCFRKVKPSEVLNSIII